MRSSVIDNFSYFELKYLNFTILCFKSYRVMYVRGESATGYMAGEKFSDCEILMKKNSGSKQKQRISLSVRTSGCFGCHTGMPLIDYLFLE